MSDEEVNYDGKSIRVRLPATGWRDTAFYTGPLGPPTREIEAPALKREDVALTASEIAARALDSMQKLPEVDFAAVFGHNFEHLIYHTPGTPVMFTGFDAAYGDEAEVECCLDEHEFEEDEDDGILRCVDCGCTEDEGAGMVAMAPVKPPVHELNGPLTYPASAFPDSAKR